MAVIVLNIGYIRCRGLYIEQGQVIISPPSRGELAKPGTEPLVYLLAQVRDYDDGNWQKGIRADSIRKRKLLVDLPGRRFLWRGQELRVRNREEIIKLVESALGAYNK